MGLSPQGQRSLRARRIEPEAVAATQSFVGSLMSRVRPPDGTGVRTVIAESRTDDAVVLEISIGAPVPDLVVASRRGTLDVASISRILGWLLCRKTPTVHTGDYAFDDVFRVRARDLDAVPTYLTAERRALFVSALPAFTSLILRKGGLWARLTGSRKSDDAVAHARDVLRDLATALR